MEHAFLSPSAAHRWLHCTAAPWLEAKVEDSGSDYAKEGTLAHALAAEKLRIFMVDPSDPEAEKEIKELWPKFGTKEMDEAVQDYVTRVMLTYAEEVKRKNSKLLIEQRVDFEREIGDALYGTCDAAIVSDDVLDVFDFKYGKGVPVSAENNPQLRIYALGLLKEYAAKRHIKVIHLNIVQPRIDHYSTETVTVEELTDWEADTLIPAVHEALEGGERHAGGWCKFCKVRATCRARANAITEAVGAKDDPRLLSPEELAKLLPSLPEIEAWCSDIKAYTLDQALQHGVKYPGYKVVDGRATRYITDPEAAASALKAEGIPDVDIYKPTELRTITDLERTVGKKDFATLCGKFIAKKTAKPVLVPESDKRPERNSAEEDFKNIDK